jgi:hypothetical protein
VFLANVDSNIRIGSGIGIDIDVEEALDLESTNTVLRADALWRFTENRRHRLDLIWFAFRRDGNRRILDDIPIEDDDGNVIIIPTGATVDTFSFRLEADGEDYPGIDLKGNVEFNYAGLQLYLGVCF